MFFSWFSNWKRILSVPLFAQLHSQILVSLGPGSSLCTSGNQQRYRGGEFYLYLGASENFQWPRGVEFYLWILIGADSFWLIQSDIYQSITFENRTVIFSYTKYCNQKLRRPSAGGASFNWMTRRPF